MKMKCGLGASRTSLLGLTDRKFSHNVIVLSFPIIHPLQPIPVVQPEAAPSRVGRGIGQPPPQTRKL